MVGALALFALLPSLTGGDGADLGLGHPGDSTAEVDGGSRGDAEPDSEDLGGLLEGAVDGLSLGEVDAQVAQRVSDAIGDLGEFSSERREGDLPTVAADVVEGYRAQGVEPVFADYLGVLGDTWACLVKGDRWVEIRIVREDEVDGTSKVETVHFDADAFAAALPEELFEGDGLDLSGTGPGASGNLGGDADAASTDAGAAR